ncbi:AraC family transcriptional regulator [Bordetella genomosp. 4]|uniref:AraC family transcriptional regulator n=1 Tax=Bordetella genomosp. 4 TaxID=463044 RepID=UPI000B9E8B1C|nr:AraC family transcriptional regulator [Bordetella genomosp. 4]OZI44333.1 AraC family transcriptional regulator [Bordetella genomosp. 4]
MDTTHRASAQLLQPLVGNGQILASQPDGQALQKHSLYGGQITIDRRRWTCREAEFRWTAPQHVIILTERGATARTHIRDGAKHIYDGRDRSGVISFVPAGVERNGYFRDADLVYTALWVDPHLDLPGCSKLSTAPLRVNTSDSVIRALMASLAAEMAAGQLPEAAYLEHVLAVISLRLGGNVGRQSADAAAKLPRLGRGVLKRLDDYIESHIEAGISLSELARLAGMPIDTFARRFKAETGMAPYAYVIERRVRRAETLLRTLNLPISEIAFGLGFSSQSHFTSTFRRVIGITPRAYRQRAGFQDSDIAS